MWGFSRRAKPDALDAITLMCKLLVERPWEWVISAQPTKPNGEIGNPIIKHISGVFLIYANSVSGTHPLVWLSLGGPTAVRVSGSDSDRLYAAILGCAAARVARPRCAYDVTVTAMIKSVQDGDRAAALALADRIMEMEGATPAARSG